MECAIVPIAMEKGAMRRVARLVAASGKTAPRAKVLVSAKSATAEGAEDVLLVACGRLVGVVIR